MRMLYTDTMVIDAIEGMNVTHPPAVKTLLEAVDAVRWTQPEPVGWEGLEDPATAGDVLRRQATYLAVSNETYEHARRLAIARLSPALAEAVDDNVDGYAAQIAPTFNKAARAYKKAAGQLPRVFDAEEMAGWDKATLDAYRNARDAAATLDAARNVAIDLSNIAYSQKWLDRLDSVLFIVKPRNAVDLALLLRAGTPSTDPVYLAVNPLLLKAVKDGMDLRFALPAAALDEVAPLEEEYQSTAQVDWIAALAAAPSDY